MARTYSIKSALVGGAALLGATFSQASATATAQTDKAVPPVTTATHLKKIASPAAPIAQPKMAAPPAIAAIEERRVEPSLHSITFNILQNPDTELRVLHALSVDQIKQLSPSEQQQVPEQVMVLLNPAQIKAFDGENLTAKQLNCIATDILDYNMREFTAEQIAAIPIEEQKQLSVKTLQALYRASTLSAIDGRSLTSELLNNAAKIKSAYLDTDYRLIKEISPKQITQMPLEERAKLSPDTLRWMTEEQVQVIGIKAENYKEPETTMQWLKRKAWSLSPI
jgi:hypothetical protein